MTESQQDVASKPRGTGMFVPLTGRDPCQQQPRANNQHKRQHRNPCRGRSRTTAVYMPFSNTGTQFHPPQGCLPVHPVCTQPGQLMLHTPPQQQQQQQQQQQHILMQLPNSGLGPRCSSDKSSSSQSSYVLQHSTGDAGHLAVSAGFVAPAGQVSTQQQTVLVHTHSLSSGSSTSSVHGAVDIGQGLGSYAEVTVSTALQPQQAQLLGEEGSSDAMFSSLGAYSSSGGGSGGVCAGQYSIWGPVSQQQQQGLQHAQGPSSSDANLTGWTAAMQPSSSSPGLAPGAVYADQDHPVMQVAAASSIGLQASHPVYCAGQHQAAVMQVVPAVSTGLSAGQPVYCAGATHAVMQITPAVSTAPGVPVGHMVYCADPGQPVMQVAPAGAVFFLQEPAGTQQMQQYQLVPASTAAVGGLSADAMAPSMVQWGH